MRWALPSHGSLSILRLHASIFHYMQPPNRVLAHLQYNSSPVERRILGPICSGPAGIPRSFALIPTAVFSDMIVGAPDGNAGIESLGRENEAMEMLEDEGRTGLHRRTILKSLAALGVGTVTFRRALAAQAAQAGTVTPEMIKQAEWIAGLELTEEERTSTAQDDRAEPAIVCRAAQGRRRLRRAAGPDVLSDSAASGRRRSGATRRGRPRLRDVGAAGLGRGAGVSAGHRAVELDPQPAGELDGADEALSRPPQAV